MYSCLWLFDSCVTGDGVVFRQDAFTLDVLEVPQGSGSGFVWDKDGHVVTNYHVIRGASDLKLVLFHQFSRCLCSVRASLSSAYA